MTNLLYESANIMGCPMGEMLQLALLINLERIKLVQTSAAVSRNIQQNQNTRYYLGRLNSVSFCTVIHCGMCTLNCSCTLMRSELVVNFSSLGTIVDRRLNEDISSNSIERGSQDCKLDVRLHEEGNGYSAENIIPLYKSMGQTLF